MSNERTNENHALFWYVIQGTCGFHLYFHWVSKLKHVLNLAIGFQTYELFMSFRSYVNHFGKYFTSELCNLLQYHENLRWFPFQSLKGDHNMDHQLWWQQDDLRATFRKNEWFSLFRLFPKCCEYIVFIGVLRSTHLLLEDSQ